jgi:hypothetical protein
MRKSSFREWIGGMAFDVFLWSIKMTEDEYLNTVEGGQVRIDNNHSVYMHCWNCYAWGIPTPENTDTCGNCGGLDVTIYYPSTPLNTNRLP